jgi:restriction endonuclease S subunit
MQGGLVPGQVMPGQDCKGDGPGASDCPYHVFRTSGTKTGFLSHLYINAIFLPRQARDKHRETSKKARFRSDDIYNHWEAIANNINSVTPYLTQVYIYTHIYIYGPFSVFYSRIPLYYREATPPSATFSLTNGVCRRIVSLSHTLT